jgi:hypothetical protein
MKTTATYVKIKEIYPPMNRCFFAFNKQQFDEGKTQSGIMSGEKIYSAAAGLYGTDDGLSAYMKGIDGILTRIPKECDPQDVYEYEFDNHECHFIHDDTSAIKLVTAYFGEEVAKTVNRHKGCVCAGIDNLF